MDTLYDPVADVLSYISRLDLDDIESLQAKSRRKDQGAAVLSDEELAMLLFAEEAEGLLNITRDHRTESFDEPYSLLQELMELEEAARYDHEVALAISEGRPIPPRSERHSISITPDIHYLAEELELVEESESDSDSSSVLFSDAGSIYAGSSRSSDVGDLDEAGPSSLSPSQPTIEVEPPCCTICADAISGIVLTAPCGHSFDATCVETMFQKATVDETLYPPRCCLMPIPPADVRPYVDVSIMMDFDKRSLEFDTPVGSRVYCCRARCSAFLGASMSTPSSLHCSDPDCTATTCASCKKEAHLDVDCSYNKEAEELALTEMAAELHKKQGWQRCYSCRHLVEKSEGCYHMVCICKAQFCYLCATRWKECECPQFEIPPELIHL